MSISDGHFYTYVTFEKAICVGILLFPSPKIASHGCFDFLSYACIFLDSYRFFSQYFSIHMSRIELSIYISVSSLGIRFYMQFFPKQLTVGVLNAVLSVSALAGVLCPPR